MFNVKLMDNPRYSLWSTHLFQWHNIIFMIRKKSVYNLMSFMSYKSLYIYLLNMFYFISHEKILGRTQMLRSCPLPITVTRVFRYLFMQQNIHTNVTSIIPPIQNYKIAIHNVEETCFRMDTVHSSLWNNTKHRNNLEFIESNP